MKITRIETFPLEIPLHKPVSMAGRRFVGVETVVIRLTTDDGWIGFGEAAASPFLTGETIYLDGGQGMAI